ncbi:MAG: ECF transporter S component [Solobacterium sp.]|nr:ECF transporter S component [Solobacterium sp.]
MNKQKQTRRLVLFAFFVAIELVLMLTPIGYIPIGPIRATTMHLPVLLAGILLGPKWGALLGLVFGLTSLATNTFSPTITSFVFSPFITVGGIHGNFWSLVIVLVPRILLGLLAGLFYRLLEKLIKKETIAAMISAACNTLLHTILVMGGIWVFFAQPYAAAKQMTIQEVWVFILGVITSNGVMEMIVAAIIIPILVKALKPTIERLNLDD